MGPSLDDLIRGLTALAATLQAKAEVYRAARRELHRANSDYLAAANHFRARMAVEVADLDTLYRMMATFDQLHAKTNDIISQLEM